MKTFVLWLGLIAICLADATQEGRAYAKDNHIQPTVEATGLNPSENPAETAYSDASMREMVEREKQSNETFLHIKKAQNEREDELIEVKLLDVEVDTLQEGSADVLVANGNAGNTDSINKTCLVSGDHYTQTCKMQRLIDLVVIPEVKERKRYCSNGGKHSRLINRGRDAGESSSDFFEWKCSGCCEKDSVKTPKSVTITKEEWVGCEDLEAMRDRGDAEVLSETPGVLNDVRVIQGETMTRDYFETTRVYALNTKSVDTCTPLRVLGCELKESRCVDEKQIQEGPKICLMYKKTYACPLECPLAQNDHNQTKIKFGLHIPKGPPVIANQK